MRLMSLGAVKCIGLCMRLELEESFCYLLCSLSEVGRQDGASLQECNFRSLPSLFLLS